METEAVFDAGPPIHLEQVDRTGLLELFDTALATEHVAGEIGAEVMDRSRLETRMLEPEAKDLSKIFTERYSLDMGESTSIALCQQLDIKLFFTDDQQARDAAEEIGLEPHGTLALVTRAFREEIIDREAAKNTVKKLYKDSSLFITRDLVNWALEQIDKYPEQ